MWECTGCRFLIRIRRACIGISIRTGLISTRNNKERNEVMPVAVALGCDPAITYASTAPLPEGNL